MRVSPIRMFTRYVILHVIFVVTLQRMIGLTADRKIVNTCTLSDLSTLGALDMTVL